MEISHVEEFEDLGETWSSQGGVMPNVWDLEEDENPSYARWRSDEAWIVLSQDEGRSASPRQGKHDETHRQGPSARESPLARSCRSSIGASPLSHALTFPWSDFDKSNPSFIRPDILCSDSDDDSGYTSRRSSNESSEAPPTSRDMESPTSANTADAAQTLANRFPAPITYDDAGATDFDAGNVDPTSNFLPSIPFDGNPTTTNGLPYGDLDNDDASAMGDTFDEGEQDNMRAFAKVSFPDGEYYFMHPKVVMGRDMDAYAKYMKEEKVKERQKQRAKEDVWNYQQEPSHHSQHEEDPSSKSAESLEGRPASGLPSSYSEQGGIASFPAPDDSNALRRQKIKQYASASSSTTSVAPAHLQASAANSHVYASDPARSNELGAFVPIHPPELEHSDIRKISKEHITFYYDSEEETWRIFVTGAHVYLNEEVVMRSETRSLHHKDQIHITSLTMIFMLPNPDGGEASPGPSMGAFTDDAASQALGLEGEEEEATPSSKPKKKKILLDLRKKKKAEKEVEVEEALPSQSPEAVKKPEKGKQPKTAAQAGENGEAPVVEQKPPPPPPSLTGTSLEGLQPHQLPAKRSGPGRPPKNGLLSKRHDSLIKRKIKDLEKLGQPIPPLNVLLDIVRQEDRQKDLAAKRAKAEANGQPIADEPIPSIETDFGMQSTVTPTQAAPANGEQTVSATPVTTQPVRKTPPKVKQRRPMSPLKPKSEYTEEELKKPAATYLYQIDEVLREIGQGDLQDIYATMRKKWPYYEYVVDSKGWESSVRHNLLQHDRFQENGRSGKGKLWMIDESVALEKEKKRRATPPAARQPQPQNVRDWPPGTYNHSGVPYGYAPPAANGAAPPYNYASPYGQQQPGYGPNGQIPGNPYQHGQPYPPQGQGQRHNASQPQTPAPPPTAFQRLVNNIVEFRTDFLKSYQEGTEQHTAKDKLFSACVTKAELSRAPKKEGEEAEETKVPVDEEEKRVLERLNAIFDQHKGDMERENAEKAAAAAQQQAQPQAPAPASAPAEGVAGSSSAAQAPAMPSASAAAPPQVQPHAPTPAQPAPQAYAPTASVPVQASGYYPTAAAGPSTAAYAAPTYQNGYSYRQSTGGAPQTGGNGTPVAPTPQPTTVPAVQTQTSQPPSNQATGYSQSFAPAPQPVQNTHPADSTPPAAVSNAQLPPATAAPVAPVQQNTAAGQTSQPVDGSQAHASASAAQNGSGTSLPVPSQPAPAESTATKRRAEGDVIDLEAPDVKRVKE
jgi:hypothetical protein